jgi:uncharacterized protein (TIGR03067 family)
MRQRGWVLVVVGLLLAADTPKEDPARKELKENPSTKELKSLTGTWMAVSGEENGKEISKDDAKAFELTIKDGKYTLKIMGKEQEQGTITVDPEKKPKTIDIDITSGDDKGKSQKGIYELDGDTLKVCVARPEEERPKELAGKAASLWVFKRAKP